MKRVTSAIASFLIFIFLSPNTVFAQKGVQQLSTDVGEFSKQMIELFEKSKREDGQEAAEQFVANLKGAITGENQTAVINTVNEMLKKRMRTYPHLFLYISTINQFVISGAPADKFTEWHGIVEKISTNMESSRFADWTEFLNFSQIFFEDFSLYKTRGKRWEIQMVDYEFKFTDNIPELIVEEASLYAYTAKDTMGIINTKGSFFPMKNLWKGQEGKVTWERLGFDPNTVYVEIGSYDIDLNASDYVVEDALFYHKTYFQRPLKGKLTDKLSAKIQGTFLYPEFLSYETDIHMKNIAPQLEFEGGFGLQGEKIIGFGTEEKKAAFNFYAEDGRKIMVAKSHRFGVKPKEEINSVNTTVSVYFAQDSIYHPSLNLRYNIPNKDLQLVRDSKASSQIAFMSSFHQLEANVDAIFWKINTPVINFKMASLRKDLKVIFESFNLFEKGRMLKYSVITGIDPVRKLGEIAEGGTWQLESDRFASLLGNFQTSNILATLFDLVEDGFIYYDGETKMITIRDKALHYLHSMKGETDYDRILLVSNVDKPDQENAQLDLDTKELLVTGVEKVALSDSQQVVMFPHEKLIRVKRNRNMEVDGTIVAGRVDLTGKNFFFDYDPFTIKLDSVDKMQIYVPDETGKHQSVQGLAPINTTVRDVSGTLFIDKENNKSGLERYPSYPRFVSDKNSFLYYENPNLYDGAYSEDKFYFQLDPFEFEDLDEIMPEQLNFAGTMVSGGIFPDFKQEAKLQEDLSLGFTEETKVEGYPIYGLGTFTGSITMSNNGMKSTGRINYLSSMLESEQFHLLPDSLMAKADTFAMERKKVNNVEFPSAHNGEVGVKWLPKSDSMRVTMRNKKPFTMFEDKVTLKGGLLLSSKGLKGEGTMNMAQASIRADEFTYTSSTFQSDSSDVVIKNEEVAKVAFNSYNVKSRVDMDDMIGEFLANGDNIPIVLPYNQYKTTASEFYWVINEKLINIRMPENSQNNYFESTHPDQGGLKFEASGGVVNLEKNTIQIDGVPYINIADAKIRPYDTKVLINPEADIQPLERALIVADTLNEYHKLSNVTVKIKSINEFEATGTYRYKGKGLKNQKIDFDLVSTREYTKEEMKELDKPELKGKFYTYGATNMPEEEEFKLNKNIDFKGNILLDSREQFLVFDGFAQLELLSPQLDVQWFSFKDAIDPDNIQMDVTNPIGERKDTLMFGVLQDMDSLNLYSAFLTKKRTPLDVVLFRGTGDLSYDSEKNMYQVASKEKLSGESLKGDVFTLLDETNQVVTDGRIYLGEDYGLVKVDAAGRILNEMKTGKFEFRDVVMGIDFHFDEELLESIGESFRYYNAEADEVDYSKDGFVNAAVELASDKDAGELKRVIGQYGYLPERFKGLDQSFLLTDLQMVFDTSTRTVRTTGPIGVSFTGERYVNRMVDGYIEFGLRRSGDYFDVYFELQPDENGKRPWYYFSYKKGTMMILSSEPEFNQKIADIKEKNRMKEDKKRGLAYQFTLAPMLKRNNFVARMKAAASSDAIDKEQGK